MELKQNFFRIEMFLLPLFSFDFLCYNFSCLAHDLLAYWNILMSDGWRIASCRLRIMALTFQVIADDLAITDKRHRYKTDIRMQNTVMNVISCSTTECLMFDVENSMSGIQHFLVSFQQSTYCVLVLLLVSRPMLLSILYPIFLSFLSVSIPVCEISSIYSNLAATNVCLKSTCSANSSKLIQADLHIQSLLHTLKHFQ